MSAKVSLAEFIVLATVFALLVAVIVAPTASDAATLPSHAVHLHRITEPTYGFAPDRAPIPDSGYDGGNPIEARIRNHANGASG
jgi:hypothetical protein